MTIDSISGLLTWTPTANDEGFKRVVVVVSDGTDETLHIYRITVRRRQQTNTGNLALRGLLLYFEFETDSTDSVGQGFEAEIRIQFTERQFRRSRLRNKLRLALVYYRESDSTWVKMPTSVDTANCTAVCTTSHFSIWALADEDNFGGTTGIIREEIAKSIPDGFLLGQNFPNPFNPETKIIYRIPEAGKVTIKIFNILGQDVKTLVNKELEAGTYEVVWNGRNDAGMNVSSGIYFYRIKTKNFSATKKMMLVR